MISQEAVDAYVAFFESLTPDSLTKLDELCAPDVRFRDPFNEVVGPTHYRAVFEKMFADVAEPRFHVTDRALSGRVCYLRWRFTCRTRRTRRPLSFDGMSEVHFSADGKVTAHIDHWDATNIYEIVPLLGAFIRMVKRRLALRQT